VLLKSMKVIIAVIARSASSFVYITLLDVCFRVYLYTSRNANLWRLI